MQALTITQALNKIGAPVTAVALSFIVMKISNTFIMNRTRDLGSIIDEVLLQVTSHFEQDPNPIDQVKQMFPKAIYKASYLSGNGFAVLHSESVLAALRATAESLKDQLRSQVYLLF